MTLPVMIGMPLLALRRDNGRERLRVILPRICRLPRPADNCHSNKYPLWVSAIDENARSLRPDDWRVNPCKEVCRGISGMFRKGSGFRFSAFLMAPSRAGSLLHLSCLHRTFVGVSLLAIALLQTTQQSAGRRQQQIRHRTAVPTILAMLIQRTGNLVGTHRQH
jgi:hypothetical protein